MSNRDSDTLDNLIVLPCSNDFCVVFATQTPAIADEEIYRQYNRAIRAYAKEYGGSVLAAYPFIYDDTQKLQIDKRRYFKGYIRHTRKRSKKAT